MGAEAAEAAEAAAEAAAAGSDMSLPLAGIGILLSLVAIYVFVRNWSHRSALRRQEQEAETLAKTPRIFTADEYAALEN